MERVTKVLEAMASGSGKQVTPEYLIMMLDDLTGHSPEQILMALKKCRKEIPRFPTIADIVQRIDDGHPDANQAWGMLPTSEYSTTVWTDVMGIAFDACSRMITENDMIGARIAFMETYKKALADARSENKKPKWSVSLGWDRHGRIGPVCEAVAKGLITRDQALNLLPENKAEIILVEGPAAKLAIENKG